MSRRGPDETKKFLDEYQDTKFTPPEEKPSKPSYRMRVRQQLFEKLIDLKKGETMNLDLGLVFSEPPDASRPKVGDTIFVAPPVLPGPSKTGFRILRLKVHAVSVANRKITLKR